ncbi:MAG TPA: hypothetical protein VFW74_03780 [Acidimicrobiia bacterium]|nr:hypothetical protein [Acidimicrobiia bacterium]
MHHLNDVGVCERCHRWQRRRHAFLDRSSREARELCATRGCDATWDDDIRVVLAAEHDPDDPGCQCRTCLHRVDPSVALLERAADRGHVGPVVASPHLRSEPHRT